MKITSCSMGCMYATGPVEKCLCSCKTAMHGLMVKKPEPIKCSPAVEKRCKAGLEGGPCKCACGGHNHGLYRTIADFSAIKINQYN